MLRSRGNIAELAHLMQHSSTFEWAMLSRPCSSFAALPDELNILHVHLVAIVFVQRAQMAKRTKRNRQDIGQQSSTRLPNQPCWWKAEAASNLFTDKQTFHVMINWDTLRFYANDSLLWFVPFVGLGAAASSQPETIEPGAAYRSGLTPLNGIDNVLGNCRTPEQCSAARGESFHWRVDYGP